MVRFESYKLLHFSILERILSSLCSCVLHIPAATVHVPGECRNWDSVCRQSEPHCGDC